MLHGAWVLALSLAAQTPPSAPDAATPADTAAGRDRPFAELFQNLVIDARAIPSRESALLLGFGSGAAYVLGGADRDIAVWSDEHAASNHTRFASWIGDGWVQTGGALSTYVVGLATKKPRVTHVGSDLIRGQLLNGVITRSMKILVDRRRPSGGGHSFPSGHSSAAFTSAAVLHSHFGWKVAAPAYAVAGFVGWTRVRDRAHWLSDVAAGATIGTIVGRAVAGTHGDRAWVVVPAATSKSVSFTFARSGG